MNTLILFSGGIDSTYSLWRWLEEHREGPPLLVHRTAILNKWNRERFEGPAAADVLGWMREQGLSNFEFSQSGWTQGDIPQKVDDVYVLAFLAGYIARCRPEITRVIRNYHADAFDHSRRGPVAASRAWDRHYRKISRHVCGRDLDFAFPMARMKKREYIAQMPATLLERCFWCRRPDDEGRACRTECYACALVIPALEERGLSYVADLPKRKDS